MRNWLISVMCLAVVFFNSLAIAAPKELEGITMDTFTQKYFVDAKREFDPVEGVWITSAGTYTIGIVKNTFNEFTEYPYVGINLVDANGNWKPGSVKLLMFKGNNNVYLGGWRGIGPFGSRPVSRATYAMINHNTIQATLPEFGNETLLRLYPKGDAPLLSGTVSGTGFFVTPNVVITNYHVVVGAKKIEITFQNEYTLSATVLSKDESNDVAILSVQGLESRVTPFKLGKTNTVREGERVYTIGFPLSNDLGTRHKISEGLVNGLTGLKDDPTVFQISIPIQPGNSGGPLILNDGRVVGITSSGLNSVYYLRKTGSVPQNVNFAIKADYIMPLLDVAGIPVERTEKQGAVIDPVSIMDMGKSAVVFVKAER